MPPNTAKTNDDAVSRWALQLQARVGYWKAIVAIAARNARMCWAVLKHGESFKVPAYEPAYEPAGEESISTA